MIRPLPAAPEADPFALTPGQIHARAAAAGPGSAETADHPSVMLEVLAAPFRGAEGAVRSAYNGLDLMTGDALPDYSENFLGTSQTTEGAMVEGVSQFLTGFVPVLGVATRGARLAGLGARAAGIAGGAGAGAFSDFVAFEGHEERLSNLIQRYPQLQNPVTEFLAADADDSEVEGRFKNALEGLALGALTEPTLRVLGAMGKVRKAKAGALPADAAKAAIAQAEASAKAGLKAVHLAETETAFTAKLKDKPELSALSDKLNAIRDEDIAAGGLFQDPAKDFFRFVEPNEQTALVRDMARKQLASEEAAGLATEESIKARNATEGKLLGELVDMDPNAAADIALGNARDLREATYLMGATRKLMLLQSRRVVYLAGLAKQGAVAPGLQTVEQTIAELGRSQQALSTLVLASRRNGTEVGRALNAIKYTRYAEVESIELARQAVESMGGTKFLAPELEKLALAGQSLDPQDAAKAVLDLTRQQHSVGDRLFRVHNEYWINSILSGTKTTVVNTLGNTMTTLWQPLEAAIGAAIQRDGKAVAANLRSYVYMAESFKDAARFFAKAIRENENFLTPELRVNDVGSRNAIDASKLMQGGEASRGLAAEGKALLSGEANTLQHFVNFMGETVRLPSRFLMGTDEFFKQLNYRAAAKSELYYRGRTRGLEGADLTNYIAENFGRTITDGGSALSEGAVVREAVKQAEARGLQGKDYSDFIRQFVAQNYDAKRSALAENFDVVAAASDVSAEATFTRELGQFGTGVQRLVASHPAWQLIIPFVRTPTNIAKYFGQRGLGALTYLPGVRNLQARNLAELASDNPMVRAKAQGRIATGSALVSLAGLAAAEGKVTGRGPRDEQEKRLLMETGWQPYSFVFESAEGPVYVSYQRLDPLATFFGLMADWGEQAKHQDPFKAGPLETVLQSAAVAVSGNITNKTYLASLAQVIDVISQPDRSFAKWSRARVASYVPSVLAQFNSSLDDGQTMKEIRDYFDALQNRVPGGQAFVEPKRNILGEAVDAPLAQTPLSWLNPFTVSKDRDDPVFKELAKLNHGLQPPSPVIFGNVNLLHFKTEKGQSAYDRMLELVGSVKVGGRDLRTALTKLVESPAYQKMPLTSPQDGLDSPRLFAVKRLLSAYSRAANSQVQREVPSVREAVAASFEAKSAIRRGDRARALQSVQAILSAAE